MVEPICRLKQLPMASAFAAMKPAPLPLTLMPAGMMMEPLASSFGSFVWAMRMMNLPLALR